MKTNNQRQFDQDTQLRQGLPKILGKSEKLDVQGKEVKCQDYLDALDERRAATEATSVAREAFHRAVAAEKATYAETDPMLSALRTQLVATRGDDDLKACGLARRKASPKLTAEEQAVKVAKARATREAKKVRGDRAQRADEAKAQLGAIYGAKPTTADASSAANGSGTNNGAHPPSPS